MDVWHSRIRSVNPCIIRLKKFKNHPAYLEMMHLRSLVTSRHQNLKSSQQGVRLTVWKEESKIYLHLCHRDSARVSRTIWVLGEKGYSPDSILVWIVFNDSRHRTLLSNMLLRWVLNRNWWVAFSFVRVQVIRIENYVETTEEVEVLKFLKEHSFLYQKDRL